ncbi:MAG TPA: hypothetical protein VM451_07295 [Candidatus Limnocylindria bacterium]|nr:hypothetical protein [Candidatus Limnocylindria bacterium]
MRIPPVVRFAAAGLLLAASLAAPPLVRADEPGQGQLLVPGDHHLPGAGLQITGYDLDPGDEVRFQLVNGLTAVDLGRTTVSVDGTLSTPATVPASFPNGYADIVGTGMGGGHWKTVVLIGERAEGPDAQPSSSEWPVDRIMGVAMLATGLIALAVLVAVVVCGRRGANSSPT